MIFTQGFESINTSKIIHAISYHKDTIPKLKFPDGHLIGKILGG